MKKIIKQITLILFSGIVLTNCSDFLEEKESVGDAYGVLPTTSNIVNGFFDLTDINNTFSGITIGISESGGAQFSSGEVFVIYNGGDRQSINMSFNTVPADLTFQLNDILTSLSIDPISLEVGDQFDFYYELTTAKGEKMNSTFRTRVLVSCSSDLAGSYSVLSSGTSTDSEPINNPITDFAYDVVITDNGGGNYTISDGVAGLYMEWYCTPYGYCFETEGNFTDICGDLSGTWTEAFGCDITLTGTDNGDGTLSINWSNCFGDSATAIYTKQ